jgi:S1-C subfamily serine protease
MVKRSITSGALLAVACLLAAPARGQHGSILKQMQDDVSKIVSEGRKAVVTVEECPHLTVVLTLQNQLATKIAFTLNSALKGRAGVHPDERTNSLIYSGQPAALNYIKRALTKLDKPGALPELELTAKDLRVDFVLPDKVEVKSNPRSGSGFSIGDGFVLTSADVIEGMQNPTVVTDQGVRVRAQIVGTDLELNLGMLKLATAAIEKVGMGSLKLGVSSTGRAGHFGISIGNQTGAENTSALMIVGGIRNDGAYAGNHFYPSLIQIAGSVGAGSSGSPLLNADGQVIGILVGVPADSIAYYEQLPSARQQIKDEKGVPVLKDIPYVGRLFRMPEKEKSVPVLSDLPFVGRFFRYNANWEMGDASKADSANWKAAASRQDSKGFAKFKSAMDGVHNFGKYEFKGFDDALKFSIEPPIVEPLAGKTSNFVRKTPYRQPGSTANASWTFVRPPVTSAGYAIPIDVLRPTIEALRTGRPIVRAWLGVDLQDELIPVEESGIVRMDSSVRIGGVFPDSPALRVGLRRGDILRSLNGLNVKSGAEVRSFLMTAQTRGAIEVEALRDGNAIKVMLPFEGKPADVRGKLITDGPPRDTTKHEK